MKNIAYSSIIFLFTLISISSPAFSQSKQNCSGENQLQSANGRCIDFSSLNNQDGSVNNSGQTSSSNQYIPASKRFRGQAFGPIIEPNIDKICKGTLRSIYPSYSTCIAYEGKAKKTLEENEHNFMGGDIQQCYSEGRNLSEPVVSYVQKLTCVTNRMNRRNYLKR